MMTETRIETIRERAVAAEPWPAVFPDKDTFRALRLALNLRQTDVAGLLGVSRMTVVRYEAGEVAVPTSLNGDDARRVLTVMAEAAVARTTTTSTMFQWDGEPERNPQLQSDAFWMWCQQDDVSRIPFPLLPWPSPEQQEALLDAVGWTTMRTARNFHVPGFVVSQWRSSTVPPSSGHCDYSVVGAQAGWSALAWATGLPPAPKPKARPKRARKVSA